MAGTINVGSAAELLSALSKATGGETILLSGGDYGTLSLMASSGFDITFPSSVTITSVDPQNPAVFSGLDLRGAANLSFEGVTFDFTFEAGDQVWSRPFSVSGSQNISFTGSTFDGDMAQGLSPTDDGYGAGYGLSITDSSNVTVSGCEFFDFMRGMVVSGSNGLSITGNDLHSIRSDGMDFAQVSNVLIEDNTIHDFLPSLASGDHLDFIQFWTTGTTAPSTDIVIRGNHLDIGTGGWAQSIFMRNELVDLGLAGPEMLYRNVLIEDNVIVNAHIHGITVGETSGLVIRNNTVVHSDGGAPDGADSGVEIPAINLAATSTNVTVTGNITSALNGWTGQVGWTVSGNAFVQDQNPDLPGWYGDVFVASSLVPQTGRHDFVVLPGGMADILNSGASATQDGPVGEVAALFHVTEDADNSAIRIFDASFCRGPDGPLPAGTTYLWTFGDGSTATGVKVGLSFPTGGRYEVALTVRLPDGSSDTESVEIGIPGSTVLTLGANGGFIAYELGEDVALGIPAAGSAAGLQIKATGVATSVAHAHVRDIQTADEFLIEMRLRADTIGTAGEVFRLHASFDASVNASGAFVFRIYDAAGKTTTLTAAGTSLSDGAAHDVQISYGDGIIRLSVDGNVLAEAAFTGPMQVAGPRDLTFGNPWNSPNFHGDVTAFGITVNASDYEKPATAPDKDAPILMLGDDGGFIAHEDGADIALGVSAAGSTDGLQLPPTGIATRVAYTHVHDIQIADAFLIEMTLRADTVGTSGRVFSLPGSFTATVNARGDFVFRILDDSGKMTTLTAAGTSLSDGAAHDVQISYSDGTIRLSVDDDVLAEAAFTGPMQVAGTRALVFGHSWSKPGFHGDLTEFSIIVNQSDEAATSSGPVLQTMSVMQHAPSDLFVSSSDSKMTDDAYPDASQTDTTGDPVVLYNTYL